MDILRELGVQMRLRDTFRKTFSRGHGGTCRGVGAGSALQPMCLETGAEETQEAATLMPRPAEAGRETTSKVLIRCITKCFLGALHGRQKAATQGSWHVSESRQVPRVTAKQPFGTSALYCVVLVFLVPTD